MQEATMQSSGLVEDRLSTAQLTVPRRVVRLTVKMLFFMLVSLVAVFMIMPFAWMVITSIKPNHEIFTIKIIWIPSRVSLHSYKAVFAAAPFLRYMLNSLYITGVESGGLDLVGADGTYKAFLAVGRVPTNCVFAAGPVFRKIATRSVDPAGPTVPV